MSGVIDEKGQQWEHCYECGRWVAIERLWYVYEGGHCTSQLCASCYAKKHGKPTGRYTGTGEWLVVEYNGQFFPYHPEKGFLRTGRRVVKTVWARDEYHALEWINYYILNAYKMQLA